MKRRVWNSIVKDHERGGMAIALVALIVLVGIAFGLAQLSKANRNTQQAKWEINRESLKSSSDRAFRETLNVIWSGFNQDNNRSNNLFASYPIVGRNDGGFSVSFNLPIENGTGEPDNTAVHCDCVGPGCLNLGNPLVDTSNLSPSDFVARMDCESITASSGDGSSVRQQFGVQASQRLLGDSNGFGDGNDDGNPGWNDLGGNDGSGTDPDDINFDLPFIDGAYEACALGEDGYNQFIKKYFTSIYCEDEKPRLVEASVQHLANSGAVELAKNVKEAKTIQNAQDVPALVELIKFYDGNIEGIRNLLQPLDPNLAAVSGSSAEEFWTYLRTVMAPQGLVANLYILELLRDARVDEIAPIAALSELGFENLFYATLNKGCSSNPHRSGYLYSQSISVVTSTVSGSYAQMEPICREPQVVTWNVSTHLPSNYDTTSRDFYCKNCPATITPDNPSTQPSKLSYKIPAAYRYENFCGRPCITSNVDQDRKKVRAGAVLKACPLSADKKISGRIASFIDQISSDPGTSQSRLVYKTDCLGAPCTLSSICTNDGNTEVQILVTKAGNEFGTTRVTATLPNDAKSVLHFSNGGVIIGRPADTSFDYCGKAPVTISSTEDIIIRTSILTKKFKSLSNVSTAPSLIRQIKTSKLGLRDSNLNLVAGGNIVFDGINFPSLKIDPDLGIVPGKPISATGDESLDPSNIGGVTYVNAIAAHSISRNVTTGKESPVTVVGAVVSADKLKLGEISEIDDSGTTKCHGLGGGGSTDVIHGSGSGGSGTGGDGNPGPLGYGAGLRVTYLRTE